MIYDVEYFGNRKKPVWGFFIEINAFLNYNRVFLYGALTISGTSKVKKKCYYWRQLGLHKPEIYLFN